MSIVTRTGDQGTSGLFGGQRISKSSPRLHAYGTVDELNAVIGLVLAEPGVPATLRGPLEQTQRMLFRVGADLATHEGTLPARPIRVEMRDSQEVERWIEDLENTLPVLKRFILPSGSRVSALLHHARTICRRAERWVVALSEEEPLNPGIQIYLNRLGDYLFLAAREANRAAKAEETEVTY